MGLGRSHIRVLVLGGGAWGTTVASLAATNAETFLWCRDHKTVVEVNERHQNSRYLDTCDLHPNLKATTNLDEVAKTADLLVVGTPTHSFRETLRRAASAIRPAIPVLSLAKGFEQGSRLRMSQVVNDVLPGHPAGVLTGPNLAKEVLAGEAAATVVAMPDEAIAERLQRVFSTERFHVYLSDDVTGCELGGALKNVIALASGIGDGLGAGDNMRAVVITRGLAELTRLGQALGARAETFAGLSGMGDLIATCASRQSRNRHFGHQLGVGRSVEEIAAEMDQVAEGVKSTPIVCALAEETGVDMPIAHAVNAVLRGERTAAEAYDGLFSRPVHSEFSI